MTWQEKYQSKIISAKKAAGMVTSGSNVLFPVMDQPKDIMEELCKRYKDLNNVTLTSHWIADYPFLHPHDNPRMARSFQIKDPMPLIHTREELRERRLDYQPTVFGLNNGTRQAIDPQRGRLYHYKDFFFFKLTPPDKKGNCSFGPRHWFSPSACRTAKIKIAEIDPRLPRVYGEFVHIDEIDYLIEAPESDKFRLEDPFVPKPSRGELNIARAIGKNAASLVKDGDTLEIGVGTAAEAVIDQLADKNDLGIDTEVIFQETVDLAKRGVITGKRKTQDKGKVVSSCLQVFDSNSDQETKALKFVTDNPSFEFRDISSLCHVPRIASQNNMVAINNLLGIDLQAQGVVTHLGTNPISSPGGQVEFCIGSHYSKGGRSIALLNSTALGGSVSRIVPKFDAGVVITIPMFYLDYVVTEYGITNLNCKSSREKAEALISIAHPNYRQELEVAAKEMFYPA